jgi:pimeloyl-ACP methyl ester carboxylesterase
MSHVLANHVTLHVEEDGDGPAIVLLHGWSMSGRFFGAQLGGALPGHRVVVPDFRGHGRSEKVLYGHTVGNYASDIRLLLEELLIERPVLVGWSMGAMVVLEYVKAFGESSVKGIGIVEQPPSDLALEGLPYRSGATIEGLAESVAALQLDQTGVAVTVANLMLHEPTEPVTSWIVSEMLQVPPAIASTLLVDQTLKDYREVVSGLRCPTLVIFGRDPKATPPEAGTWISEQIPGSHLEMFEHSSHCPFLEEPARFNQVLREWIASLGDE